MRCLPVLAILLATPAAAEVTHSFEGRFGVGYTSATANAPAQTRPLYEGRYTSTFTQRADNGLTFRFELDVIVGNLPERGERARPARRALSIEMPRD